MRDFGKDSHFYQSKVVQFCLNCASMRIKRINSLYNALVKRLSKTRYFHCIQTNRLESTNKKGGFKPPFFYIAIAIYQAVASSANMSRNHVYMESSTLPVHGDNSSHLAYVYLCASKHLVHLRYKVYV